MGGGSTDHSHDDDHTDVHVDDQDAVEELEHSTGHDHDHDHESGHETVATGEVTLVANGLPNIDIYTYKLADPTEYVANSEAIGKWLNPKMTDSCDFSVAAASGCLRYMRYDEIYNDRSPAGLAADNAAAVAQVETLLAGLQSTWQQNTKLSALPCPIPNKQHLRAKGAEAIINSNDGGFDHWLVRYELVLPVSPHVLDATSLVYGAGMEVRVGRGGRLIGLIIRVRPFITQERSTFRVLSADALNATFARSFHEGIEGSHEHDHVEIDPEVNLASWLSANVQYFFFNESLYQSHLCPYYVEGNGHDLLPIPVSEKSLLVRIQPVSDKNMRGFAVPMYIGGGSGKTECRWRVWKVDDQGKYALYKTSNNFALSVEEYGNYYVDASVTDTVTGITMSTRSTCFQAHKGPAAVSTNESELMV